MGGVKWPTEFPGLEQLDRLLRCGICYEYFSTALMTSCSHNYCSLCIRKSIGYRTECPTCTKETFESELRNNRILDDIVSLYLGFKSKLVTRLLNKCSGSSVAEIPICDPHVNTLPQSSTNQPLKSAPIEQKISDAPEDKIHTQLYNKEIVSNSYVKEISVNELRKVVTPQKINTLSVFNGGGASTSKAPVKIPSMFSPKKSVPHTEPTINKVSCPVCSVDIPEKNINFHLDSCLKRADEPVINRNQLSETRKPLKKPVFHLLKLGDLKKMLKDHGLNFSGSRDVLVKRFQRYILLYNAECDSLKPRSVTDIIRQLEQEEHEEKKVTAPLKLPFFPKNDNEKSDEIRRDYLKKNKSTFDDLIRKVKQQKEQKLNQKDQLQALSCTKTTVTVMNLDDNDNFSHSERKSSQNHDTKYGGASKCNGAPGAAGAPEIFNKSGKKPLKRLQFSDDEEEDIICEPDYFLSSLVKQSNHIQENKNTCTIVNDSYLISVSSAVTRTPTKFQRDSDATVCDLSGSQTPETQVSPIFRSHSSLLKQKTGKLAHSSPELFADELQASCNVESDNTSDAESEKSVSLFAYDEDNRQTSFQFHHETVSNNTALPKFELEEDSDLGVQPLFSSEEQLQESCGSRKRSRRQIPCGQDEGISHRVLRKRSKR